eukprot:CAMPEP_0168742278 /NCGR_PEP_ID=MMETSP0724-20121128/12952_1 /TAXON_ID=265536 /ORGANISM="Amphiprora sp., Strain CCMP467" /LENGTH=55 /DNA_ID=CAMNT_0008789819 /DNA_START=1059 /DNA_END=1226 /DNA_ORIENTATION=+
MTAEFFHIGTRFSMLDSDFCPTSKGFLSPCDPDFFSTGGGGDSSSSLGGSTKKRT